MFFDDDDDDSIVINRYSSIERLSYLEPSSKVGGVCCIMNDLSPP